MYTTSLRKVGGSVMLAVPPAILEMLHLKAGDALGMEVRAGRLIIERKKKVRYTLDDMLEASGPVAGFTEEDRAWLDSGPVGRELL